MNPFRVVQLAVSSDRFWLRWPISNRMFMAVTDHWLYHLEQLNDLGQLRIGAKYVDPLNEVLEVFGQPRCSRNTKVEQAMDRLFAIQDFVLKQSGTWK